MSDKYVKFDVRMDIPEDLVRSFVPVPREFVEEAYRGDDFLVFFGPQHPGSGHMRIILRLRGDYIVDAIPDPGYVHRGVEKLAETRLYIHNIPLLERPSIPDSANIDIGYCRAIEELMDAQPPDRALYIRVILAELSRIANHLYDAAILAVFIGHSTGFMWGFGLRDVINEAFVRITGTRTTLSFIVPGGVRWDVDQETLRFINELTRFIERKLKAMDSLFIKNPVVVARLRGVGVLSKEDAVKYGLVGPFLRASGVEYDVRKVEPYEAYEKFEWDIPVADDGDAYSRLLVRVEEMRQSLSIIRQAVGNISEGPVVSEKILARIPPKDRPKVSRDLRNYLTRTHVGLAPPPGEVTTLTEAARGTLLFTLVSDGHSTSPYRLRMITPSWFVLRGFMESLKGERLADLPAIYGSFGYFPPEADR